MEAFDFIIQFAGPLVRVICVVLVILTIIFVHEMGHYLVGRWCGIGASTFSLGFGLELFGYTDKRGTRWRLALVPLGGYVKFLGDEDAASMSSDVALRDVKGSFAGANAWARAATVFAGPLFNAIFTVVIFTYLLFMYGSGYIEPVVGSLVNGAPAVESKLQPGDRFLEMDGQPIKSFSDVQGYVSLRSDDPIVFKMERAGQSYDVVITPRPIMRDDGFGNKARIGTIGVGVPIDPKNPDHIDPSYMHEIHYSLWQSFTQGNEKAASIVTTTFRFIGRLVQGREDTCQLSGPMKTANIAMQVTSYGFVFVLQLVAFLSISIGLINLLPIPPLDGGHLLFYLIEAVIGRPVPKVIQETVFKIGFIAVLTFMIFAIFNDPWCWLRK